MSVLVLTLNTSHWLTGLLCELRIFNIILTRKTEGCNFYIIRDNPPEQQNTVLILTGEHFTPTEAQYERKRERIFISFIKDNPIPVH